MEQIEGFRLSPQQRRLWLRGAGDARVTATFVVDGDIDEVGLGRALGRVTARHETLRTRFAVPPAGALPVQVVDDIDDASSPWRIGRRGTAWEVTLDVSASCVDPVSCTVILADLAAACVGADPGPVPLQYADASEWFNEQLETAGALETAHWESRPSGRPSGHAEGRLRCRATRTAGGLGAIVSALAGALGVSADAIVLACWAEVVRGTHARGHDVVGVVRDGRFPELATLVGPVEALVPVRLPDLAESAIDVVARALDGELREADHALLAQPVDVPVPGIGFRRLPELPTIVRGGTTVRLDALDPCEGPVDALLRIRADGPDLLLEVRCVDDHAATGLPAPEALAARTEALLRSVAQQPTLALGLHPVLLPDEASEALRRLNPGGPQQPPALVVERVFTHAETDPEGLAAVSVDGRLTWAQLADRSERVARRLVAAGVGEEDVVAIVSESSIPWLVAVVGVWRARAACLAIDGTVPVARAARQLEVVGARVALLAPGWDVPHPGLTLLHLGPDGDLLGPPSGPTPPPLPSPANLAFVTFTSGTTGRPKGVAVEHRQLAAYAGAVGDLLRMPRGARLASLASPTVDLGATAWLVALHQGATVAILPPEARLDPAVFAAHMRGMGVDLLKITPSHLSVLLADRAGALPRRALVLGGEQLDATMVARIREQAPELAIFNHYGPTETTVGALVHRVDVADAGPVPIGRALASARALPGGEGPVPAGRRVAPLWLGGPSVTRGYLGDPRATADRFRPDPERPGGRAYLTGDLIRLDSAGAAVYVSREDDQTKVRGVRVEPREVDLALQAMPGVARAATLAVGEGLARQLESWVVSRGNLDLDALLAALRESLPDAMVPARVHMVDAIPMTAGGKRDRAALLRLRTAPSDVVGRAPETPVEVAIAACFERVLGAPVVNAQRSFFDLGGHSLLAVVAVARLREELGLDVTVKAFFDTPSVVDLAALASPDVVARAEVMAEVARMSDADVVEALGRRRDT